MGTASSTLYCRKASIKKNNDNITAIVPVLSAGTSHMMSALAHAGTTDGPLLRYCIRRYNIASLARAYRYYRGAATAAVPAFSMSFKMYMCLQ